jgi:hypothetical protein
MVEILCTYAKNVNMRTVETVLRMGAGGVKEHD